MIFFSYIPIILISCINFWFLSAQNCTNPLLNYDIFDDIIFYGYPTLLTETLGMCNLTIGNYSCCSALNANDIGVVYDKFKTRIEDYNSDWILNYKNLFNPFLDLDTMGITNDVPDLLTDLKEVIINYRKEIQKINKLQSQCASTMIQMFAGSLCMTCLPEYENFMSISNPEQTNTSFSKYTIFFANSNCDKINDNCREYLELRKTLETRIYFYMVEIIDTLTAYIGEMPYQNISLLSSLFSNASALSDTNLNSRLLSTPSSKEESPNKNDEYDNNNLNNIDLDTIYEEVEPEYETIDSYSNIANLTSISSPYSLDRISRRLKSSGRGSSGGRSSGSRSSGRSSSSSSSSSSGRSTGSSSSSTSSSSGSSSTTTSSTGSSGGRSVYSSRTTYGARTTTASRTVKSSSTARSSFTRSSTSSAYNSYSTRSSRTYSYSRTNYIIIYNSGYGSRYRGYYYRNRYGTNQEKIIEQSNGSTGVSYQIAKADDYQGILSPFYLGTNFPADVQIQEANYHKIYVDWINGMVDGMNLIENCPIGKSKCRVCVSGNCSYFTKSTSEYYDKYCNIEYFILFYFRGRIFWIYIYNLYF